ncbi:MAG TPA: type II toxin-antitoxin system VapC family toxin [Thermoanaerobaculia bacterium]|nr:type II toxin-antitoxin system VapC family toxin [Thermoanaerobaculia bacterium]
MIFVDSNIPMYLVGESDMHRVTAQQLLERFIGAGEKLVTDAEVFQEILHRYGAIGRSDAIQPAFELLVAIVDEVWPIEFAEVQRAREVLTGYRGLSARDAVHIATMERHEVDRVLSFDRGFDRYPGLSRIPSGSG